MGDYVESLFKSVDILINRRLEDIAYDTTLICTVIDASNSKNGQYRVTDGSVTYTAYSDQSNYKVGDQVRLTVPMGDFSQKKFITGKYVSDNDANPITYVSPADKTLNISGNLANGLQSGIVANGTELEKIIWQQEFDDSFIAMQNNNLYDTVILKADFKTLLSNYGPVEGNYGLRLDFLVAPSIDSDVKIRRSVELDSSEMFGNPYSFAIYSPQAKTIKIDTMGILLAMELTLYQKKNFKNKNEQSISYPDDITIVDNILVKNIALGFGCDLELLEDNKLQLYTTNDLTYKYGLHNEETNLKTMGLLWVNKDENNQYVGFSDGIYSPQYDELSYLEKSKLDNRLIGQKGKANVPLDKQSLELSADLEEATAAIQKAVKVVTSDLVNILIEFKNYVLDVESFKKNIEALTKGDNSGSLLDITSNKETGIEYYLTQLSQQYDNILKYGYEKWKGQSPSWDGSWEYNYHKDIKNKFISIEGKIESLLSTSTSTDPKGGFAELNTYTGYQAVYDTYSFRIRKVLQCMKGYLGWLVETDQFFNTYNKEFPKNFFNNNNDDFKNHDILMDYKDRDKESYEIYQTPDLSAYDNKYCIYWYRWEKDYIAPSNEKIMPDGWRRLTPSDLVNYTLGDSDQKNVGLPSVYQFNPDEALSSRYVQFSKYNSNFIYYEEKSENNYQKIGKLSKEDFELNKTKYYVRAHVNGDGKLVHAPKVSNGNGMVKRYMQNDLEQEKYVAVLFYNHNMYKSNELIFTNSEVVPDKTTLDKGDILIFDHLENSTDSYQIYNITNNLMDARDETFVRQLRCHYDGLLAKDNALVGGQIYWYVPGLSTMLTVDVEDLKTKGFVIDESRSEYTYTPITIKSKSGFESKSELYIKSNSSYIKASNYVSGTKYYEKGFSTYCFYKTIYAKKKDNVDKNAKEWDKWDYTNGTTFDNRDFWYKIKPYYENSAQNNTIHCEFIKAQDVDSVWGEQLFTFGTAGTSGTKYTLAITNATSQVAANSSAGLPLLIQLKDSDNKALELSNNVSDWSVQWNFSKSGGKSEIPFTDVETATEKFLTTPKGQWGILEFMAKVSLNGTKISGGPEDGQERIVDLKVQYPVPFGTNDYFIQGPTQIIYNNQGILDNNSVSRTPYKLFKKQSGNIGEEVTDIKWLIRYYKKDDSNNLTYLSAEEQAFYNSYMPRLKDNVLSPASLYLENLDCYAVVYAVDKNYDEVNKSGTIYWRQPIIIIQNKYASSMLNDWDESFKIDEENGTIMSTMVGAGRKTANNTFEGVLMGDIAEGAGVNTGNKYGLGLYGFNDGAQSFGLNIDGTAFFGKAGRGRISIDGNEGTISSASYEQIDSAGMLIDLDDGIIDIKSASEATFTEDSWKNYQMNNFGKLLFENYNEYKKRFGKLYEKTGQSSQVHLDVNSPYFYIVSQKGNRLINIGTDDAFNIERYSNNSEPNPFQGKGYYFKSDDYLPSTLSEKDGAPGEGMLFDLAGGKIDAYNFTLRGEDSTGSFLQLSSNPNNFIQVNYKDDNLGSIDILKISKNDYFLHSFDWYQSGNTRQGMELNIETGTITAYSNVDANKGKAMLIDASAATYPIQLGTIGNYEFNVGWDGSMKTPNFTVDSTGAITSTKGKIGGWNILSDGIYSEDSDYKTAKTGICSDVTGKGNDGNAKWAFWTNWNGKNAKFYVRHDGFLHAEDADITGTITTNNLTATYGKIGSWTISGGSIVNGQIKLTSSGTIEGAKIFKVDTNGKLTASQITVGGGSVIGGWNFEDTYFYSTANDKTTGMQVSGSGDIAITVGATNKNNWNTGQFYVTHAGVLHATEGHIKGSFTIEPSGSINVTDTLSIESDGLHVKGNGPSGYAWYRGKTETVERVWYNCQSVAWGLLGYSWSYAHFYFINGLYVGKGNEVTPEPPKES